MCLSKREKEGGELYTICGLDIVCRWGVEIRDIYSDFDKHCLLSQKRLIQGNIKLILNKFVN